MKLTKVKYPHETGHDYVCEQCIAEFGYYFAFGERPIVDDSVSLIESECPTCHRTDDKCTE